MLTNLFIAELQVAYVNSRARPSYEKDDYNNRLDVVAKSVMQPLVQH
jgi:hypothetical protein